MLDILPTASQARVSPAHQIELYAVSSWRRLQSLHWRALAKSVASIWRDCVSFSRSIAWIAILIFCVAVFLQSWNRRTVTIETIAVPKNLQENGLTGDVAAQRLRDAIDQIRQKAKTSMKNPSIQLHGEEQDFVVPAVGLSLDAVVATVRRFLHDDGRRIISGDLTLAGAQLWLRLRLNGKRFYEGHVEQATPALLDQLFAAAAHDVMWKIDPYLVASAAYAMDDFETAMTSAQKIIDDRLPPDENLSRAYNLEALIYLKSPKYEPSAKYEKAMAAVEKALDHPANRTVAAMVRNTRGSIFLQKEDFEHAEEDFQAAIYYDASYTSAYINLIDVLHRKRRDDDARIVYNFIKRLAVTSATDACNLANTLSALGRHAEARVHYEAANKIDRSMVNTSKDPGAVSCAPLQVHNAMPSTSALVQMAGRSDLGRDPEAVVNGLTAVQNAAQPAVSD